MASPKAVLFDLDGTLVDTIGLYGEAVLQALREMGISGTTEQFRTWYTKPVSMVEIFQRHGRQVDEELPQFKKRRDELYINLLREKSEWLPGAEDYLDTLIASQVPRAVVTGSWMSYVDAIDERLDVKKYFPVIVTVDDMGDFGKPHPYGLLLAADRLGVKPEHGIYVGDQWVDLEAAKRAGMKSVLMHSEWTPKYLSVYEGSSVSAVNELERAIHELLGAYAGPKF